MAFESVFKPLADLASRVFSPRKRVGLCISAKASHRVPPGLEKTTLFITLKIENRRPEQIQIDQWGVNTTKSRVGYTQVFDLNTFTVVANADCEVTEKIDDDIAHALPAGAEVFCETATGETVTAPLKVPAFPRKTVG